MPFLNADSIEALFGIYNVIPLSAKISLPTTD